MMKRRSRALVDYSVPTEEDEDDDFVDGKSNREKNNNDLKKANKSAKTPAPKTSAAKKGKNKAVEPSDDEEEESDESVSDDEEDESDPDSTGECDGGNYKPRTLSSSSVSVVKNGPKKLILKKKKLKPTESTPENDENRQGGETVTLIRGLKDRKFVLFKSDNFNFSVNKNVRRDLVHHFSTMETNGPSTLPSALLVKPLLNR